MEKKLQQWIGTLVQFTRLAAVRTEPNELLSALAAIAVDQASARGAAVVRLGADGVWQVVAERGAPNLLHKSVEIDVIGPEAGHVLLQILDEPELKHAQIITLLAGSDIFGFLALFSTTADAMSQQSRDLLTGLVDITAAALDMDFQRARFDTTYAELEASRRALVHAEKVQALGKMAAGVSHDLKNVFNPLLLQLQLLRRRITTKPEAVPATLDAMEQVIKHGLQRVDALRSFSRQTPDELPRSLQELNVLVQESLEFCRLRAARPVNPVQIEAHLGDAGQVFVETAEFVSAIVNIVVNAIEAMPNGGKVSLESGKSEQGPWVRITDTGPGIAPQFLPHIFEPFYTTKGEEGTGLGLSTVYSFMQRHLGTVTCRSEPGVGTTFVLQFPQPPAPVYRDKA